MGGQLWEVVGGADKGGILVREGRETSSPQQPSRLATGALVEEVELVGERLSYKLQQGSGPDVGWVSIKLPGKDLLIRKERKEGPAATNGEAPAAAEVVVPEEMREAWDTYLKRLESGGVKSLVECYGPQHSESDRVDKDFMKRQEAAFANFLRMKDDPTIKALPPYRKLKMTDIEELAVKTMNGEVYGLPVPPTLADLQRLGESWLTDALHAAGTMPKDNKVKKVLDFTRLPMDGVDAAGGSGPKAFLKLEYEKEDPELHKDLFVKMPWSVGGESHEMGGDRLWRWKISCFQDNDGQEVSVYRMLGPLFPFKIPKYYFADICRENTNFILITEKLIFGKKGKEKYEPYEILPLAEKYFDFQLAPKMRYEMYYCLCRAQARLAAWDKMGYFNIVPHETRGYHMMPPQIGQFEFPRKLPEKQRSRLVKQGGMISKLWAEFLEKAKKAFPSEFSEPAFVEAVTSAAYEITGYRDDVNLYLFMFPEYTGLMHSNLQSDNAYYWYNDEGEMDCGIIDWGGLSPGHVAMRFSAGITSAEGDILDEHEDGLLRCWADEYYKECGIKVDLGELKRQWFLMYMTYLQSCGVNIDQEIFRQCPREEWETITSLMDNRVAGMWNCRCYAFMINHALRYLHIRWKRAGGGRLHIHETFLQWKALWTEKGMT